MAIDPNASSITVAGMLDVWCLTVFGFFADRAQSVCDRLLLERLRSCELPEAT